MSLIRKTETYEQTIIHAEDPDWRDDMGEGQLPWPEHVTIIFPDGATYSKESFTDPEHGSRRLEQDDGTFQRGSPVHQILREAGRIPLEFYDKLILWQKVVGDHTIIYAKHSGRAHTRKEGALVEWPQNVTIIFQDRSQYSREGGGPDGTQVHEGSDIYQVLLEAKLIQPDYSNMLSKDPEKKLAAQKAMECILNLEAGLNADGSERTP